MKSTNIVHEYFKRDFDEDGFSVLVRINPHDFSGLELIVAGGNVLEKNNRELDEEVYEDLKEDGFEKANALEFNMYLAKC